MAITLLGFGLGGLLLAAQREGSRGRSSLREQAIEAQREAARAYACARELTSRWNEEASRR